MRCLTGEPDTRLEMDPEFQQAVSAMARIPQWIVTQGEGGVMARLWHSRPEPKPTDFVLRAPSREQLEELLFTVAPTNWRWVSRAEEDAPSVLGAYL